MNKTRNVCINIDTIEKSNQHWTLWMTGEILFNRKGQMNQSGNTHVIYMIEKGNIRQ